MRGSFDITCVRRPDESTAIGSQSISAPWHLSKPYWDGEVLLVQAVNATAGIFAGDHLTMNVCVDSGASVLLTSPSASRIHTMPRGEATLTQHLRVESGGWLEWMPELFIPQRGCRYRQSTEIEVASGASAYLVETLAPGRVAHGEAFAFEHIAWQTRIRINGQLMLAEHFRFNPADQSLRDLRGPPPRYFANAVVITETPMPVRAWQEQTAEWTIGGVRLGITQPAQSMVLIRLLADSSEQLKSCLSEIRSMVSAHMPRLRQSARKL